MRTRFEFVAVPFHSRYLALVDEIEHNFPVAAWRRGDSKIKNLAGKDV